MTWCATAPPQVPAAIHTGARAATRIELLANPLRGGGGVADTTAGGSGGHEHGGVGRRGVACRITISSLHD